MLRNCVGVKVLTAVEMSMFVFWVVTPSELVGRYFTDVSERHTASVTGVENADMEDFCTRLWIKFYSNRYLKLQTNCQQ
jgi:hypothetical protein